MKCLELLAEPVAAAYAYGAADSVIIIGFRPWWRTFDVAVVAAAAAVNAACGRLTASRSSAGS